ncbi:hypothetical protein BWQ96_03724 [Gracilariopsis chorda]|uniref:Smr domain-containing protein n=1 Tax=Gracilariopsis chorda TaxID=448386 RepID=A0A2V3IWM1_9FLOR|nr:hypothetical protein BWQ96_03724 [Gracilariopsis chorda]|eukprot:PXF46489.1 hypothetical protein BWQ96_03724 [Gracilariopsis chorda]
MADNPHPHPHPHHHVTALNDLVANYPDITLQVVHDVLQACDNDHKRAYETICEMLIPPDSPPNPPHQARHQPKQTPHPPPSNAITFATPPKPTHTTSAPSNPTALPQPRAPQGVWATNNTIARRYQTDHLHGKYQWMPRAQIQRLLNTYHGCLELVEEHILAMFPIDQPQAFGAGQQPNPTSTTNTNPSSAPAAAPPTRRQAVAESLRQKDAAELNSNSLTGATPSSTSELLRLRHKLWEQRALLSNTTILASHTRKTEHRERAKQIDHNVKRLSETLLDLIRRSDEYRNGVIDLHGLTKEEAIQLVEWKLVDSARRRFRVITGKGIHSHREQAVLRPALEKHFRSKGISFTRYEDGVLSVIPR